MHFGRSPTSGTCTSMTYRTTTTSASTISHSISCAIVRLAGWRRSGIALPIHQRESRRSSKWTTRKRQRGLLSSMARSAWDDGDDPRRGQFRGMPLPGSQFSSLPVIGGGTTMTPDGQWHTLVMNLETACARSGRFTFRRALFARLLGSLDIKRLRLDAGRLPPTPR